jgi:hypothetical protein
VVIDCKQATLRLLRTPLTGSRRTCLPTRSCTLALARYQEVQGLASGRGLLTTSEVRDWTDMTLSGKISAPCAQQRKLLLGP